MGQLGTIQRDKAKRLFAILGMAVMWPSIQNQLMYPITFTYGKEGAPAAYSFYLVYLAVFAMTCIIVAVAGNRLDRALFCNRRTVVVPGLLGLLGTCLIVWADFSNVCSIALVAFGAVLIAIYTPVYLAFWAGQLADLGDGTFSEGRSVAFGVLASYALFCLFTAARLSLELHAWPFAIGYAAITTLCALFSSGSPRSAQPGGNLAAAQLPRSVMVASLGFILLSCLVITLLNPNVASFDYPPNRACIYWTGLALMVAAAFVFAKYGSGMRRATVILFAMFSLYLVAMFLLTALFNIGGISLGNFPIIAGKNVFELLLFLVVVTGAHNKHASPTLFVALFLLTASVLPNLVSVLCMYFGGFYTEPLVSDLGILVIVITVAFGVSAVANIVLLLFVVRRTKFIDPSSPVENAPQSDDTYAEIKKAWGLSDRELDIVKQAYYNKSAARIAQDLCIAEGTVYTHLKRIYKKAGVHSRQEMIDMVETFHK